MLFEIFPEVNGFFLSILFQITKNSVYYIDFGAQELTESAESSPAAKSSSRYVTVTEFIEFHCVVKNKFSTQLEK